MIPRELWQKIFTFLDLDSQNIVSRVSVDFFQLIVSLWKSDFIRDALKKKLIFFPSQLVWVGGVGPNQKILLIVCLVLQKVFSDNFIFR